MSVPTGWIVGASLLITSLVSANPLPSGSSSTYSNASSVYAAAYVEPVSTTTTASAGGSAATQVAYVQSPVGGSASNQYHGPAFLPNNVHALVPNLDQSQTNGPSSWGTLNAPTFGSWVNGPLPNGYPWGTATANNTNYYVSSNVPNTGMTRSYDFTIARGVVAPDGVQKESILVNGQFPGPVIEANWGDWIEVTVHNDLPDEGTSLHWHGLLQKASPWMDGVPGIQQCPIAPGSTFTYRFQADLYGTSWYHGHYSAQYAGGLLGPMLIHGPKNADYDIDIGPVLLSDWYHDGYLDLVEQVMSPLSAGKPPPVSNNTLIQGKNNYPCASTTKSCTPNAGIAKFNFQSGKKHLLRLINTSAEGIVKFSIDNHNMTVVANDFVPLEPYEADVVTLSVGQRAHVIVDATGNPSDAVWMRANLTACSLTDGISPAAVAAIYYENANTTSIPTTVSSVPESELTLCQNDDLSKTQPYYPLTPDPNPATTQEVTISFKHNGSDSDPTSQYQLFYVDNSTFRVDYNDPVMLEAKLGNTNFDPEWNVYDFGSNKTVRLVVYNESPISHPMHLHGHNMYVLDQGTGTWDGTIINAGNPQRRDVHILPAAPSATTPSYIVVQIDMDNAGVWPFHCHIAWHVSAGLYLNILEQPDTIASEMQIPGIMAQTCRDWTAWTGNNIPDQIDSGL